MRIALRELRRRPSRFATATIILTLIAILLMFLGGLLDGLLKDATGAVRAQDGDVIVYSATARDSFFRSRIPPELRAQVEAVPGVAEVGARVSRVGTVVAHDPQHALRPLCQFA